MYGDLYKTLEQESFVIRSCLATGLTELRNANLNEKGRYYSAFFQLAIGIERLAKMALILDHMARNNLQAPGHSTVKGYGHDLQVLVAKVSVNASLIGSTPFPVDPLCKKVIAFFSEFATGMRYANLDALATGKPQRDPLGEWNDILQEVVATKIRKSTHRRIAVMSNSIAERLEGTAVVMASDLAGEPLTLSSVFSEPSMLDAASKHLVWEVITLLGPLRDVVVKTGYAVDSIAASRDPYGDRVPTLSEFFDFIWVNRPYVLRKKRWP
ncbi:hypothetical protein LOY38_05855 [Pseudomonas sp. B21-015]|uniref:hypothetical protein n=1 Tax=Pseudomonas sp. B21-015 TaxID=2895473 RepID=UPI00216103E5|nr:hypothetical protein [Pseudomonas sp. B21-015]UVM51568.1 hypothetical protein LOY38_05855 [Pseudomonas sp. B21-015]